MDPVLVAALDTSTAAAEAYLGTSGDYRVGGEGDPVPVTGFPVELPDDISQRPAGRDRVRRMDYLIRRSVLAGIWPAGRDTLTIATGEHAGRWHVLGVERHDAVGVLVRLRWAARIDGAAPGAREVLR